MFQSEAPRLPSFYFLLCRLSIDSFISFFSLFTTLSLRALSPPFIALVHVLLAVFCRCRFLLLMQPQTLQSRAASSPDVPVQGFRPPDVPVRGCFFPGCSSLGSLRLSACRFIPPDAPVLGDPLPPMIQSVAQGSPPDDRVRGLCSNSPRMLQSGA